MNFCTKCDNLYGFVSNQGDNENDNEVKQPMSLRCQACGFQSEIEPNMQIYARQYVSRTHDMPVDPDLQYDHTLTRTSLVPCLNDKCPTNNYFITIKVKDAVLPTVSGALVKLDWTAKVKIDGISAIDIGKKIDAEILNVLSQNFETTVKGLTVDDVKDHTSLAEFVMNVASTDLLPKGIKVESISVDTSVPVPATDRAKNLVATITNEPSGPRREVATYQYNSESGKLGYICLVCLHYWKNL